MEFKEELAQRLRKAATEVALLEAKFACASPAEREQLLHPVGRDGTKAWRAEEYPDRLEQAHFEQFQAEYKAERHYSEAEMDELLADARTAAAHEVALRSRAGRLLAG